MFDETRAILVYLQFAQEHKYWAEAFNALHDDWVDVGEKYLAPCLDINMWSFTTMVEKILALSYYLFISLHRYTKNTN